MRRILRQIMSNVRDLWKRHPWMVGLFFAAVFVDALSTTWFMHIYGPEAELHPVIRYISHWLGPILGPWLGALGKAVLGLMAAAYLRRLAPYILVTATVISFWAGWYNVWGYRIYRPVLLDVLSGILASL